MPNDLLIAGRDRTHLGLNPHDKFAAMDKTASQHRSHSDATATDASLDWDAAVQAEAEWVRNRVSSRVDNAAEADDIAQEVLLAAIRKKPNHQNIASVRAWLYRVLVCRVADHYRQRYADSQVNRDYAQSRAAERQSEQTAQHSQSRQLGPESRAELQDAIEQLELADRTLMELKYRDGWTHRQIAEHFDTTQRSIEYRLLRVKETLRKLTRQNNESFD